MKPAQTAEEALKERQRTIANYRRLKKAEWDDAAAEEPLLGWLEEMARKCRDPDKMIQIALVASTVLREKHYPIALSLFGRRIEQLRRRGNLDPFDDPLPPQLAAAGSEEDDFDTFQIIRGILT